MRKKEKHSANSKYRVRILGKSYEKSQLQTCCILMLPVLSAVFIIFILPFLQVIKYSLTDFNIAASGKLKFIGFENFRYILSDSRMLKALGNTICFAILKLLFETLIAFFIALLLDTKTPMRSYLRFAYFAPVVVPVVASSLIWIWFFDPDLGPLNQILRALDLPALKWLNDSRTALISIIIFSIWKGIGYDIMLFLAGLQNIPDEYIDAAKADGAGSRSLIFRIKLPLLRPMTSFIIMIGIINTFKAFTEVDVMTPNGGPSYSTALIVNYIYEQAFIKGKMGRACAASIILFSIILILTLIQTWLNKHRETIYA